MNTNQEFMQKRYMVVAMDEFTILSGAVIVLGIGFQLFKTLYLKVTLGYVDGLFLGFMIGTLLAAEIIIYAVDKKFKKKRTK